MIEYRKVVFPAVKECMIVNDKIDEEDIPSGNLLVKTLYSQVSCGTETACYRGQEIWFKVPGTPGYSAVGEVIAVADGVIRFSPGDRIFFQGKHAEYQYLDEKANAVLLPDRIDLTLAPNARLFAIAMTALRVSRIELGDNVLVVGQGIIGNAAAQLAKLQGANVVVMDLDESRLELSAACGLGKAIVSKDLENPVEAVKSAFDGDMPYTVIDATGIPAVIDKGIDYVKPDGTYVLLGSPRGTCNGDITHFQQHIHRYINRVTVIGAHERMCPGREMPYVKHSCERNQKICLDLIRDGRLVVEPLVTHILPPSEAPVVYRELDNRNPDYVGIVFDWSK